MHPKAQALHPRKERIYVKVSSDTDQTGYMQPTAITWTDGRIYKIEAVKDFLPSNTVGIDLPSDCCTVVIKKQLKHLFFEQIYRRFNGRYGRWFVEV